MQSVILFNFLYLVIAVLTVFIALRVRDWFAKVKFRENVLPIIKKDALATSIYYGAWVVGVCYLAGAMLGVG